MHYTNEAESRLTWESLKVFRNFAGEVGCGLEAPGFVPVVDSAHAEALRANVAMQQRLGIDTRLVSREELREISPDLRVDDIGAAAYEPGSGFADPNATTFAFAAAARRLGATIETDCGSSPHPHRGRPGGGRGDLAGRVTAVPGAWAGRLLDPLGLDFGLTPYRIQVSIFRWPDGFTRRHPAVIDSTRSACIRPEGNGGRCVAEWIVKGKPETPDLSRFRSTRFAEGQPWIDATDYGIERPTISR
jgi:glycine/D-amino acid oxidase-like deaminating enzyme